MLSLFVISSTMFFSFSLFCAVSLYLSIMLWILLFISMFILWHFSNSVVDIFDLFSTIFFMFSISWFVVLLLLSQSYLNLLNHLCLFLEVNIFSFFFVSWAFFFDLFSSISLCLLSLAWFSSIFIVFLLDLLVL